jgi:putative Holliday junction resolvase
MKGPTGLAAIPPEGRVLGVDLGSRRVGVAVSDSGQRMATAVRTLGLGADREGLRRELAGLVEEYEAAGVVVGLPLSLSGSLGPAARAALGEVGALRAALPVPVETEDERLSTTAASAQLAAGGTRGRTGRRVVDAVAAAVLLQTWLDRRRAGGAPR